VDRRQFSNLAEGPATVLNGIGPRTHNPEDGVDVGLESQVKGGAEQQVIHLINGDRPSLLIIEIHEIHMTKNQNPRNPALEYEIH